MPDYKDAEGNNLGWPPYYDMPDFTPSEDYSNYDLCVVVTPAVGLKSPDAVGIVVNCHNGQILSQHQSSNADLLKLYLFRDQARVKYEIALDKSVGEPITTFVVSGWSSAPEWLRKKTMLYYKGVAE